MDNLPKAVPAGGTKMRKNRFSGEQMSRNRKQVASGKPVGEAWRQIGIPSGPGNYFPPKTVFSRSVTLAAGSFRILISSCPTR